LIAEEFAIGQVLRLSGLPGFPDEAGQQELVRALVIIALGFDHAATLIDRWLEANEKAPTPAGLYQLAAQVAADEAASKPQTGGRSLNDLVVNGFLYSVWTDRDVAIHRALAADGATDYARKYAQQVLAGWEQYCSKQSDAWEVPLFDHARYRSAIDVPGHNRCGKCQSTGWEYLGSFHVRRCACTVVYRPKHKRLFADRKPALPAAPKPPQTQTTPLALPAASGEEN
jgi:hypothetical protein